MPNLTRASDDAIGAAAGHLRAGGVVAFPTETVYGLGADTFNVTALARVYELKGRPAGNPLIAHVRDEAAARRVVAAWEPRAARLAERFWPGPLTLVLARAEDVPPLATGGRPTIAVRAPDHPVALKLLEAFGGPVSAPSANRSGGVSATSAEHVAADFGDAADLVVLDGGPCSLGIESTVLDLTGPAATVLRPGAVPVEALREVLGDVTVPRLAAQAHSPGTGRRHYAPSTPAELVSRRELVARLASMPEPVVVICFPGLPVPAPHRAVVLPDDPVACGARLYAALREADAMGAARILIEQPPSGEGLWPAVRDRLRRATQE